MGGWCQKFSNYMGHWCPSKSNYMGGWYFAAWKGMKEYYLPQKREKFYQIYPKESVELSKPHRKRPFLLYAIVKTRMFPSKINSPIVASVAVFTSLGKHVFSEEFIIRNAIG